MYSLDFSWYISDNLNLIFKSQGKPQDPQETIRKIFILLWHIRVMVKQQNLHFDETVGHLPGGVIILDSERRIEYLNEEIER